MTIGAFEAASFKVRELRPRLRALPGFASLPPEEGRLRGSGFAFDRRYGAFLESVRKSVPASATIALDAPPSSQAYAYSAAYVLAPRRVVPFGNLGEADFAAVYGDGRPAPGSAVASVLFGSLGRLR